MEQWNRRYGDPMTDQELKEIVVELKVQQGNILKHIEEMYQKINNFLDMFPTHQKECDRTFIKMETFDYIFNDRHDRAHEKDLDRKTKKLNYFDVVFKVVLSVATMASALGIFKLLEGGFHV